MAAIAVQPRSIEAPRYRKPRKAAAHEPLVWGGLAVAAFLIAWQALSSAGIVNNFLLSTPSAIAASAFQLFSTGKLNADLSISARAFGEGFALAVLFTVPLGLLLGWYRGFDYALEPLISALYAVPKVAVLPLILIWVGVGIESKLLMVFIGAFFPLVINLRAGVRAIDGAYVRLAKSFGASPGFLFRSIILPGSLPFLLTGLRLAVARGLVGLVLGELYTGNEGIGFFLTVAGQQFRVADMFVGVFIIAFAGLASSILLTRLEHSFDRWRPAVGQ